MLNPFELYQDGFGLVLFHDPRYITHHFSFSWEAHRNLRERASLDV